MMGSGCGLRQSERDDGYKAQDTRSSYTNSIDCSLIVNMAIA